MKAKRLVALLMALVMVVGIFAMSASAVVGVTCYKCYSVDGFGQSRTYRQIAGSWETVNPVRVTGCTQMTGYHYHYDKRLPFNEYCSDHGFLRSTYDWQRNICFGG